MCARPPRSRLFSEGGALRLALRKGPHPTKRSVRATRPMNLDPAPRINKTPFILAAAGCFAVTLTVGLLAPDRFAATPLIVAVVFLILSISVIMVPIILDYASDMKDYV